ncbi:hypothetical protein [Vibrio harveyi]|uniref:hypothetical protein n=1 Tax=Vibrio harveyi TaxID=669 RepID=UPI00165DC2D7|nr:hypothetical protein [Vibrio harveyi]
MNPALQLILTELGKYAVNEVIDLINGAADNLKGRDDNTMDKDADRIKELTSRNRSEK